MRPWSLNAQERIQELEQDLYRQVCGQIGLQAQGVIELAHGIALVDVFASLAEAAYPLWVRKTRAS